MNEMYMDDMDYVPIIPDDWWESRAGGSAEKKAIESLKAENAKLRELVAHYEIAVTAEDVEPSEALAWSNRCDELRRELGIGVSGD